MMRSTLAIALCALVLVLGVATAVLAARNRARADDLDRRHHRCEILERQCELRRIENGRVEWDVLRGRAEPARAASADAPDPGLLPDGTDSRVSIRN